MEKNSFCNYIIYFQTNATKNNNPLSHDACYYTIHLSSRKVISDYYRMKNYAKTDVFEKTKLFLSYDKNIKIS